MKFFASSSNKRCWGVTSDGDSSALVQPLEKIADINTQHLGDLIKAARGHAVDAFFILVSLLVGDPDPFGELLLGEAEHDPSCPHAGADMPVELARMSPTGTSLDPRLNHRCRQRPPMRTKHQSRSDRLKNQLEIAAFAGGALRSTAAAIERRLGRGTRGRGSTWLRTGRGRTRFFSGSSSSRQKIKYRINTARVCSKSKAKKVLAKQLAADEAVILGRKARWR